MMRLICPLAAMWQHELTAGGDLAALAGNLPWELCLENTLCLEQVWFLCPMVQGWRCR